MSEALASTVSEELEQWLGGDQPKTLGNITELSARAASHSCSCC
jgi:hypothetical protein